MSETAEERVPVTEPLGSSLVIERATPAELEAVSRLEREAFSDPWPAGAFRDLVRDRRTFFAVARRGGGEASGDDQRATIAGYVIAWFVLDEGEIANLAVAPLARRQGVGAALLDAALAEARRRGAGVMHLEVRESNAGARALYGSREFVEVGRRRGYYRHPVEDALILRRVEGA